MILTVLFRKVDIGLHTGIKIEGATSGMTMYELYNRAMKDFSAKMKEDPTPVTYTREAVDKYKDVRVEKVDSEIYKSFKITCIQKDISISQGINLALASWLENLKR